MSNTVPFVCVVFPWPDVSFSPTNMDEYLNLPGAKHVVIGAVGSGDSTKSITMKGDLAQTLSRYTTGQPMQYVFDTRTLYNANPDATVSYVMGANAADGSTNNNSVAITFEITYWADMSIPKSKYAS